MTTIPPCSPAACRRGFCARAARNWLSVPRKLCNQNQGGWAQSSDRRIRHEFRLQRAIEADETLAPPREGVDEGRLGRGHVEDFRRSAQRLGGLARRGEARETRGAEGGPGLAAAIAHDLAPERGGDHATPERALRAAADQSDTAERIAGRGETIARIGE